MATVGPVLILVFVVGLGAVLALLGLNYLRLFVQVKRSDPVDPRRVTDPSGTIELEGTADVHEETGRAPFTDTESLICEWEVRRYSPGGGQNSSNWTLLESDHGAHLFVLADEAGSALVDPEGASRHMQTTTTIEVGPDEPAPPAIEEYLRQTEGISSDPSRKRRYRESRLDPGDDVHVLGPVRQTGSSFDLPGGVDIVVGLENPEEHGFTIGEDDPSELVEQIKGDTNRFIITNSDEAGAARQMLRYSVLLLVVGGLFLGVAIAVILFG